MRLILNPAAEHITGNNLKSFWIDLIILTIIFYLYRAIIPAFKYPFLLLYIGLVLHSIKNFSEQLKVTLKEFLHYFYLLLILLFLLTVSFLFSNKLYLIVFKDVINTLVLLSLYFILTLNIKSKSDLKLFIDRITWFIVLISILVSSLLLLKFFNVFSNNEVFSSSNAIEALSSDYNFALIPVFMGMIGILLYLQKDNSFIKKVIFNVILIAFSLTILSSGSRRGLIMLSVIISLIIFIQIFWLIKKDKRLQIWADCTKWYLSSVLLITFFLFIFIFVIPVQTRRNALNSLGIPVISYKQFTSDLLFRYSTVVSKSTYKDIQNIVWFEKLDSKHPETGWNSRIGYPVYPLTGKNVDIVPSNSIGYKMDKMCDASTWGNNAYSYIDISGFLQDDSLPTNNKVYYASVYCFVSNDFDGSWARISAEGEVMGIAIQEYDLTRRGMWQKLSICFKKIGNVSHVYLYWAKNGVTNFSSLKGEVIFADPEIKIIIEDPKDPDTGWGLSRLSSRVQPLTGENVQIVPQNSIGYKMDSKCNASFWGGNSYSFTDISSLIRGDTINSTEIFYRASVYCFVSMDFDGTWANISAEGDVSGTILTEYDLKNKGKWQKLQIDFQAKSGIPHVYLYWSKYGVKDFANMKGFVIYAYPQIEKYIKNVVKFELTHANANAQLTSCFPLGTSLLSIIVDKDIIRRLVAKFVSEDTTYYGYKHELKVNSVLNKFNGPRLMRWQFAGQIYLKEYNWRQKMFGGGFSYLNWFGERFLDDRTASDYPHNPFLSVLLYSGLFGLFVYILLIYKSIGYYIKYFREYYIFVFYFAITFFFSLFSSNSPFDPPIMGFFIIFPFFINCIYKKDYARDKI